MIMAATHPAERGTFACTSRKTALAGKSAFPMRCNPEDSISESNAAAAHPRLGHPRQGSEVIYGYISVE
jgi:hypothetical protein